MNPIASLLTEHREEAGFAWFHRSNAVHAPNYTRQQLRDIDESLCAHIDGLRVAGDAGWREVSDALEGGDEADYFLAAVMAAENDDVQLARLASHWQGTPEAVSGLISGLAWVRPGLLCDEVRRWTEATVVVKQMVALAALALHRIDLGPALAVGLESPSERVRSRAARAAGELARIDALPALLASLGGAKPVSRFWLARSAVLLGNRLEAVAALQAVATKPGPRQLDALQTLLQSLPIREAHSALVHLDGLAEAGRLRIIGAGYVGDAKYVPWLIEQMSNPATARIAGEAFVHVTGADFNLDQLEAMPPEGHDDGPSDDPDDDDVELPEDIALPWPDVERIKAWWMEHRSEFTPGRKLFLGKPITPGHCVHVLNTGLQRQRIIAAHYRSLIQPGTVLFPTSAPAWRQQKLLDALG